MATTAPTTGSTPTPLRTGSPWFLRRWPTGLGFALAVVSVVAVGLLPEAARPSVGAWWVLTAARVMAAGWLAHALWDVVHHRADRVVPRWYAQACLATGLTVAASLHTVGLV